MGYYKPSRMLVGVCVFILGALAGHHVYSADNHPEHQCTNGKQCIAVY